MYKVTRTGWIEDGIGYIPLTQGQVAKVSPRRVDYLCQWPWHARWAETTKTFYASRCEVLENGRHKTYQMHRIILGIDDTSTKVDHWNHDTLDNRDGNLRKATTQENAWNRKVSSTNVTGYKGVSILDGKFIACIWLNGKSVYLGSYDTPEEASRIYQEAALKNFGEFAHSGVVNA